MTPDTVHEVDPYPGWLKAWWDCARYNGPSLVDVEQRIERVRALWQVPLGTGWRRSSDPQLLVRSGYRRSDVAAPNPGEHQIEAAILAPVSDVQCFAGRVLDGFNAVPLARDLSGGRSNNVEADLFLLVERDGRHSILVAEVKEASNNAWYAVVENLLQLRLALDSPDARLVFQRRAAVMPARPQLGDEPLPVQGIVLAPRSFYQQTGKRANAVQPAQKLANAFGASYGVSVQLAVWDPDKRAILLLDEFGR